MNNVETLLILLLGSYDSETKSVLYSIKDEVAKLSTLYDDFNLIPLLLADIEVYELVSSIYSLAIVERFKSKYTIMIFSKRGELVNVEDITASNLNIVEKYIKSKDDVRAMRKLGILEKFKFLAKKSDLVFVLRHKELTRCGEYIELAYLILQGLYSFKVTFLVKDEVPISTMLKELIRLVRLYYERYQNIEELLYIIRDIINNLIIRMREYRMRR